MTSNRLEFLDTLEAVIRDRIAEPAQESYTSGLVALGTRRVAQKVGEEAVELALAAVDGSDDEVLGEAADLLYHVLVLLNVRGVRMHDVVRILQGRHTGQARD